MYRAMRAQGSRALAALLVALLVALAVSGCGATTVTVTAKATVTRPTATPYPTFDSTPEATAVPGPCGLPSVGPDSATPPMQMGDLYVLSAFAFDYSSRKLPDNTPLAPFKLLATSGPELDQQLPIEPPTNPALNEPAGGFLVTVCNASKTAAHSVQSVSMRLDSFTPYTGQLNQWNVCDGMYTPPSPGGGGCGGALAADEFLHATLTTTTVGATAVAVQTGSPERTGPNGVTGPLPVSLKPNQMMTVNLGLTPPTTPGLYSFSYALTVDGAQTPFKPIIGIGPMLLAPVAHKWGGQACTSAAMLRQIPTTSPPASYICPEA